MPSLSFSNPFQQYAGGVIPGWEYGGEATLASDYITLTPATPNKVGWVWASEPAALGSWEVQLEMHIGGAAQRGAGGGMAFWCEAAPRETSITGAVRRRQRAHTARVRSALHRYTSQQGRAGPIYGHDDTYEGLGIFFDTFEDAENGTAEPFVVAMMNYGKPIGEGDTPDYYDNQVGVCFASYRNLPNMMAARIVWSDGRLQARDCHHLAHFACCCPHATHHSHPRASAAVLARH